MYEQLFVQTSSILYATRSAKQPFSLSHYLACSWLPTILSNKDFYCSKRINGSMSIGLRVGISQGLLPV